MPRPTPALTVRWFRLAKHLSRVLELEQAASASRTRIYEGSPWDATQFRAALKSGGGLVVESPDGVVGFVVFSLTPTSVDVAKLVSSDRLAEDAMLAALWNTVRDAKRSFLNLPLILEM